MDERDDIATLLRSRPDRPLPQADAQRTALLEEMRATPAAARPRRLIRGRWAGAGGPAGRLRMPAPLLAAGALAATVAVVAAGTAVAGLDRDRSVTPATSASAPAPAGSLADLLRRVDAGAVRQPETVVGAGQFLYVRSLDNNNLQPGEAAQNREEWYSADGALFGLREGDRKTLDVYDNAEQPPAGTPALDAAILYPDPARLDALANVEPAVLLAAINRLSAPGAPQAERAFDRVESLLTNGALAFPRVRAALYHVAALIPGVRYRPDGTDLLGRHGAVLTLGTAELFVDPDTGTLLGRRGTAFQRYAVVDRIGARPEGAPVGTTPPEKPEDRTVRGLDYANQTFAVPADAHFGTTSSADPSTLPTLAFQDGVATRRDAGGRTIRYEIVDHRPIGFADLLDRVEGAVLALSVRGEGEPARFAVLFLDFSHTDGYPTKLVAWIDGGATARVSGTTVTVTPAGAGPQKYRWNGDRFVRTD